MPTADNGHQSHNGHVYVIDPDPAAFAGWSARLAPQGYRVRVFRHAHEFRENYRRSTPSCLMVDISHRPSHGLGLLAELRRRGDATPTIFMAQRAPTSAVVSAMKLGAFDFLERSCPPSTLLATIADALRSDAARSRQFHLWEAWGRLVQRLTPREAETLDMIVAGIPNKVIASRLSITVRAVEMRRASIMKKLDVTSVAQLVERVVSYRVYRRLLQPECLANARLPLCFGDDAPIGA